MELNSTKVCPCCNKELSVEKFYKNKHRPDGFSSVCKECQRKYSLKYYHRNKIGKNGILAKKYRKYHSDIKYRIKVIKYNQKYYREHAKELNEKRYINKIKSRYPSYIADFIIAEHFREKQLRESKL